MIMLGILHEDTRKDGREISANYLQNFKWRVSRDFLPIFPDSNPSGDLTNSLKQFCFDFFEISGLKARKFWLRGELDTAESKFYLIVSWRALHKPAAKIPIMISRCALWLCDAVHTGEFLKNSDHDFAVCTLTLRCHTHRGVS